MQVGGGFAAGQLAKAFATATGHEDAATRERAEQRAQRWQAVLDGMAAGTLEIGTRAPVAGLPPWATPEIVRGGFATGKAAAGGPLLPHETQLAHRVGVPARRRALFAYALTEAGLAELTAMLDSGGYRVAVPEESALLTVAWLLRAGERAAALDLLDLLDPFADRLRFWPVPSDSPAPEPQVVCRETAGQVRAALLARRRNIRVEAMLEAVEVWNPFADELLELWLEAVQDDRIARRMPKPWLNRAAELLKRYRVLAATHELCSKHRNPKENLGILRAELTEVTVGRPVQRPGLLMHAVRSMVQARGRPGSDRHALLRRQQADQGRPPHHLIAAVVATRLAALPQDRGITSTEALTAPVSETESAATGIPSGTVIARPIRRVLDRASAGPVHELIARGVVPSAEVLARLVPQLVAATTALAYRDPALRALMAAGYEAFRNRRSVLLLNLESQVRVDELPWVRAVEVFRRTANDIKDNSRLALVRLGQLAIEGFPATILPNPLVREFDALARTAGLPVPFVEELAADIFEGAFSVKFLEAAKNAAVLLHGTLYERYYGIDYDELFAIEDGRKRGRFGTRTSAAFDTLCRRRAGVTSGYSVAANGMVIEQAQILTTHNLATLAEPLGVVPTVGWPELARRSFRTACRLVARLHGNPYPLRTVKDAAYAWRQLVFYLSLADADEQLDFVIWAEEQADTQPARVSARLAPALAGLTHVLTGGTFGWDGTAFDGRRFVGWTTERHWMLDAPLTARPGGAER